VEHDAESNGTVERAVVAWAVLVFALLFLGLMPLYVFHLNLAKLNNLGRRFWGLACFGADRSSGLLARPPYSNVRLVSATTRYLTKAIKKFPLRGGDPGAVPHAAR
jgi:hypothetical protein